MNKVPPIDTWIIWVYLAGCIFATAVNVWSARTGWPDRSPVRWSVATIASLYVIGYGVMALGPPSAVVDASRFLRGISPVAWVAVWAGPPLHAWRIERRLRASTVEANDELFVKRKASEAA